MGGSIEAYGDADYSEIAATALDRYWAEMLDLVADVALRRPCPSGTVTGGARFPGPADQEPRREALRRRPRHLARAHFGGNPYAWEPSGLKESLERVDRAALIAHYRRHYVPGGMVLAVSGDVKAAEVMRAGRAPLRRAARGRRRRLPIPPAPGALAPLASAQGAGRPGADLHGRPRARHDRSGLSPRSRW